jgi:hypothetical protein
MLSALYSCSTAYSSAARSSVCVKRCIAAVHLLCTVAHADSIKQKAIHAHNVQTFYMYKLAPAHINSTDALLYSHAQLLMYAVVQR